MLEMTPDIESDLENAVGDTYAAVAADVEFMPGEEPEWAELVCDANRVEMFGELDEESLAVWRSMNWAEKLEFADGCNYW